MPHSVFNNKENYKLMNYVLWISIVINCLLIIFKIYIGYISNIQSLILDGFHSMSDFFSDILLLFAIPYVYKGKDKTHHYGHARYENAMSMLIGLAIVMASFPFIINAITNIRTESNFEISFNKWAWIITIATIILKEFLYQITMFIGQKTKSMMLIANAIHHRSDAISSMLVLVTLFGIKIGWYQIDNYMSILLGLYLSYSGIKICWEAIHILCDKAPEADLALIESLLQDIEEIYGFHNLHLRQSGPFLMGDIHLELDGKLTIAEAQHIVTKTQVHLRKHLPQLRQFTIHLDPYNGEFKN